MVHLITPTAGCSHWVKLYKNGGNMRQLVAIGSQVLDLGSSVFGREGSSPFLRTAYESRAVAILAAASLFCCTLFCTLCAYPCLMIDLAAARLQAMQKEEHSGDYQELQVLVFELCDEIEELRESVKVC